MNKKQRELINKIETDFRTLSNEEMMICLISFGYGIVEGYDRAIKQLKQKHRRTTK
jgi:hypothetical protein